MSGRDGQRRSRRSRRSVRRALAAALALSVSSGGCERARDAAGAARAEAGACALIVDHVTIGLLRTARARRVRDVGGAEREVRALLGQRCAAEGWATTVAPALAACTQRAAPDQPRCARAALVPVFAHQAELTQLLDRHR